MRKIEIYSDGANLAAMLEMNSNPLIAGLTTNPSLMKKAGITDYRGFCLEVLKSVKTKPISFEVFTDHLEEMKKQALEIKTWGPNVYVKIPITNSEGRSTLALIEELSHSGVKLNVTALLTVEQIWGTTQALKGGAASIVSVFAGRIADTGRDPVPTMSFAADLCRSLSAEMKLLWASSREVYNLVQAEQAGCHIITMPPDLIQKISMFQKDLKQLSLDTVRTFKADADAAGFQL